MSTQGFTTSELNGRTVYSTDGEKLGTVDGVLEDETGAPQYLEIKSGWFGTKRHAIPLSGLQLQDDGEDLVVPYSQEQLRNAPTLDDDEHLDYDRERDMGAYYGTDVRDWDDTRDRWLPEEDLTRGPTPETRHPDGALDREADLTQGPTPVIRETMRATSDDPGAAGQPEMDQRTRADDGRDELQGDRYARDHIRDDDNDFVAPEGRDRDLDRDRDLQMGAAGSTMRRDDDLAGRDMDLDRDRDLQMGDADAQARGAEIGRSQARMGDSTGQLGDDLRGEQARMGGDDMGARRMDDDMTADQGMTSRERSQMRGEFDRPDAGNMGDRAQGTINETGEDMRGRAQGIGDERGRLEGSRLDDPDAEGDTGEMRMSRIRLRRWSQQ